LGLNLVIIIITLTTLKNKKIKFFGMWNKILRGKVEITMGKMCGEWRATQESGQ
jgi:hypothetical protein